MKYARKDNVWDGVITSCDVIYNKSPHVVKEQKCSQCGETFKRYRDEIDYIQKIGNKKYEFCSWNCKCKFKREHTKEIEENKEIDSYDKFIATQNKRYQVRKKLNDRSYTYQGVKKRCFVDGVEYESMYKASQEVFGSYHLIGSTRQRLGTNEFKCKGHHIKVEVINNDISK